MITTLFISYCSFAYFLAFAFVVSELFGFYRPSSALEWVRLVLLVLFAPITVPVAVIVATVVAHMYFNS